MYIYIIIINITLFIIFIVIILKDMGRMTRSQFPAVNKHHCFHHNWDHIYYIAEILRNKSIQPVRRTYAFACVLILYKEEYMLGIFCAYFAIRHLLQPQKWSHLNSICLSPLF